jgi:hypothetical protein
MIYCRNHKIAMDVTVWVVERGFQGIDDFKIVCNDEDTGYYFILLNEDLKKLETIILLSCLC